MGEQAPPRLDPDMVFEFVRDAHSDLDWVRRHLRRQPRLINAAWDWGGGDWETALGAASHMGRRDIALFLLEHGARKDVFCAAMLGEAGLVRAFVAADPGVVRVLGPHGITLAEHAKAGGHDELAEELAPWLRQFTVSVPFIPAS